MNRSAKAVAVLMTLLIALPSCAHSSTSTGSTSATSSSAVMSTIESALTEKVAAWESAGTRLPLTVDQAPPGMTIGVESVQGTPADATIKLIILGAAKTANDRCGADYSAIIHQTAETIGVVVLAANSPIRGNSMCPAVASPRSVMVRLAGPLGQRMILDAVTGALIAPNL